MDKLYETKILEQLEKIKEKLLVFEQETIEIMGCDIDDIEEHSANRVKITKELDKCFDMIELLCSEMGSDGDRVRRLIRSSRDLTETAQDEEAIYFKMQQIISLLNRIKDSDVQAIDRIDLEKNALLGKIRAENKGAGAKAAKFIVGKFKQEYICSYSNHSKETYMDQEKLSAGYLKIKARADMYYKDNSLLMRQSVLFEFTKG